MEQEELLKYGNELTICGFVVGNANEHKLIYFPDEEDHLDVKKEVIGFSVQAPELTFIFPTDDEIYQIINQLDSKDIKGLQKVILRKSQRQMDQDIVWKVFRRDKFKCVYCGTDNVPMTVDHIVLWEHGGDTVPDNLNCSCRECNKIRGSMHYTSWLHSDAFRQLRWNNRNIFPTYDELQYRGVKAAQLPLLKRRKSR